MHCCDSINISRESFDKILDDHKFTIIIQYCKSCGSLKSSSHIKEAKFDKS